MDHKLPLWNAFINREPVQLMNHYKGIPVNASTIIYMLGRDILAVQVERRYLSVIRRERCTYLECSECADLLKAVPIAYEAQDGMVVLGRFGVVNSADWRRHWALRIQPKEPLQLTLDCTGQSMAGRLIDLHPGENSQLYLRIALDGLVEIERDNPIGLALVLPGAQSTCRVLGTATRIYRQNRSGKPHMQVHVTVEPAGDGKLAHYFNQRKEEIEAEWLEE